MSNPVAVGASGRAGQAGPVVAKSDDRSHDDNERGLRQEGMHAFRA